jgi:predicted nicotinamide N-methyase
MLDVTIERIALEGGDATIVRPADWQVLREEEAERGRSAPYWAIVWPSGEALADAVAVDPPPGGARVLELGCGVALPSVAAARAGATVLATDGTPEAVAFAAHSLALDEQEGEVAVVDWREPGPLLDGAPWDLVLAADVLYLQANVRVLADLLPKLVAPGGQVWIADPGRAGAQELLDAIAGDFTVITLRSRRHEAVSVHHLTLRPS